MTINIKNMNNLYSAQEKIWQTVFDNQDSLAIANTLLCGGTALARFYLDHRVSYDLDFFVPGKFNPEALLIKLSAIGIVVKEPVIERRDQFCRQLSGVTKDLQEIVKIDFIEDIYEGMFDSVITQGARTEVVDGLYHRKVRTVSGMYLVDGSVKGGRQTARDVFDLYALSLAVEPLHQFVSRVNEQGANIPVEGICKGILSMPWIDLLDDFEELEMLGDWRSSDLSKVRRLLEKEVLLLQNQTPDSIHGTAV